MFSAIWLFAVVFFSGLHNILMCFFFRVFLEQNPISRIKTDTLLVPRALSRHLSRTLLFKRDKNSIRIDNQDQIISGAADAQLIDKCN